MPSADPEPPSSAVPVGGGAEPELELLIETDGDASAPGASPDALRPPPERAFVAGWARHALAATFEPGRPAPRVELSVRLVAPGTMRDLNARWRDRDAPTNVLSFPAGLPELEADGRALLVLGDLVLCPAVIEAEARAQRKASSDHWAHLVVHGVLHLRGLDHEGEDEAREMEALETRLLRARGLPDPYGESETVPSP